MRLLGYCCLVCVVIPRELGVMGYEEVEEYVIPRRAE